MRPKPLLTLLDSIQNQVLYPDEIIIVDGSTDQNTQKAITNDNNYKNIQYFLVKDEHRGLTKQRNFGIAKVGDSIDVVCFLDDDIVLTNTYFKVLLETYKKHPNAGGVGGYIINETEWTKKESQSSVLYTTFEYDGWMRPLGSRNVLRKKLNLLADTEPCIMPTFSNGFTVANLPPSGKVYFVEYFMGGVSSFKKEVVDNIKFSKYFEGYGLYEDMDYCLRVSKKYKLYLNTAATLYHYHDDGGRPNKYKYGKMVIRNGWYVWRVKYPNPSLKARFKWNAIAFVLTSVRYLNVITTKNRVEALSEAVGRTVGWFSLCISKPIPKD